MADQVKVKLLDFWPSMYGMRARIALAEKGVAYEYVGSQEQESFASADEPSSQQDPRPLTSSTMENPSASPQLSLSILIKCGRLLPSDPHERAQARFWVDFIDKKLSDAGSKLWPSRGEGQEADTKDFIGVLKQLEVEEVLGEKAYFGGESLGFVL